MVYTAASQSLAMLEMLVQDQPLRARYVMIEARIPGRLHWVLAARSTLLACLRRHERSIRTEDACAAVAASRLAEGLAERHEVLRCVLNPDGETHPWSTRPLAGAGFLARQAFRLARRFLPVAWYRPGYRRAAFSRLKHVLDRFRPDVINVHNLHGGFERGWGTDLVDLCATHAPTVWTLHDMWSFTGRCAYAYDCRAFETGC